MSLSSVLIPQWGENSASSDTKNQKDVLNSQVYTPELLDALRADNQVVLVNMTADWCITCKVNEQVAFKSEQVQMLLADKNVHYIVGDWTNKNDAIYDYLQRYERVGVPLYVVYAGQSYVKVLPQVLTPAAVVEYLQHALKERDNEI